MESPLVSIIIPSYNSEYHIRETIESMLAQTYSPIEVILIDDGSTDRTTDFFEEFTNLGVRCFSIENSGASAARNFGLKKAKGDFIQFIDSDDLLHPDKIKLQLERMQLERAEMSFCTWVNFETSIPQEPQFRFRKVPYNNTRSGKELMKSFGMDNWFIPVFSWLTARSLLDKAGEWNTEITNNDDGEYFTRVLYHAEQVVCLDRIMGYYRVQPNDSLSKPNTREKIDSAFQSYKMIESLLLNDPDRELLAYPKRLYFRQFEFISDDFPQLAGRAAKAFDSIKADCFLKKRKKYWRLINWFGLRRGTRIYDFLKRIKVSSQ